MDEIDWLEEYCGHRPSAFTAPREWVNSNEILPFERRCPGYGSELPGCYLLVAVDVSLVPKGPLPQKDWWWRWTEEGMDYFEWSLIGMEFLYVGKARRLRSRMSEHERGGLFDRAFQWCEDKDMLLMVAFWLSDERNALESDLIQRLHPVFNLTLSP